MATYTAPQFSTFLDALFVTDFNAADTQVLRNSGALMTGQSLTSPTLDSSIVTVGQAYGNTTQFKTLYGSFVNANNLSGFLNQISINLTGLAMVNVPNELNAYQALLQADLAQPGVTNFQAFGQVAATFTAQVLGIAASTLNNTAGIPGFTQQQITAGFRTQVSTDYANFSANNPLLVGSPGSAAFTASQNALVGVSTANNVVIADQQIQAAITHASLTFIKGQQLVLALTPGIDTPPQFSTAVANALFFAPDVVQSGQIVPTLNAGDNLIDTATNSIATLQIIANNLSNFPHTFAGFTTTGIPNVEIQNAGTTAVTFDGTQAHGLKNITSINDAQFGTIVLNNIQNQVALHVTGPVDDLTLNYAHAVTVAQALDLTNAVNYPFENITFGMNAPASLAVHLTGSSTVTVIDPVLAAITVDSTKGSTSSDTNTLMFSDNGNHTILTADLHAAVGNLAVTFANNSLANGALITLGATGATNTDTLTIGQSNNDTSHSFIVNVAGSGGHYNIFLGNQNDNINLGAHAVNDTLTFIQPYPTNLDIISNANVATDSFNFQVSGFNGGTNPAGSIFTRLLAAGNAGTTLAFPVAAGQVTLEQNYTGTATLTAGLGTNFIVDTNPGTGTVTGLLGQLGAHFIKVSSAFTFGDFLVAYQAGSDVHIAEVTIGTTGRLNGVSTVHDIIDLVGQNVGSIASQAAAAHLVHFV